MKRFFLGALLCSGLFGNPVIPILTVNDSINPGTADYIISNIRAAENDHAPYLIIELDTPGGLLTSTRQIVQKMLNSPIPVVVFVGPQGARAGSAGALITFASDVAAMAPGTNIGAAHPVVPGSDKVDSTMNEKMTNDTAAFAESIAKARGRNQAWAAKAVRHSESIIADIALREGIIDMVVDSRENLLQRLPGFKLRAAKNDLKSLVQGITASKEIPMSIKNRLISFFADPNLAYMIMSLGGLCLWVEISHPGLIFPGVLGAICIVLSLISFQMMPIHYGALAFILLGMGMIIAELFLPAFGVLGIGGLVSFILGSIFLMDTGIPDFQLSLGLILSIATTLAAAAFVLGTLVWRARRTQVRSGVETLVGQFAEVREAISETGGKVFIQGELWSASSSSGEAIPTGRKVKVIALKSLALVVAPV